MTDPLETTIHIPKPNPPHKTLRDEFAMAALTRCIQRESFSGGLADVADSASDAYIIADAMMAERTRQQEASDGAS